jgi:Fe-S oxidoreductase
MGFKPREEVADQGIDKRLEELSLEQIEQTINKVLAAEMNARMTAYLQTCVHCGLCANACHYCLSHNMDPKYAPVGKVKDTVWEMVKKKGKVSKEFMRTAARIAYTECNTCRRCSMYCPFGIDIAYFIITTRRICHLLGIVPQYEQDTVNSHSATFNQMWVQQDEWIDTLQWQEEDAQGKIPLARIPLEKEGADIMYSVIAPEPKILAQLLANASIIMTAAGMSWTMPATDGWDNSNMAMFSGDFETSARLERLHHETAIRLKVKRIVMGECGHAYRGAVYDGPKSNSWMFPPIPVVHAIDFYHEIITQGKIKIAKKFDKPITVQDPCNVIRNAGLGMKLREIMKATCSDFRDVEPRLGHNYCCAAGGGVINCGPPWKKDRVKGNKIKAEQLRATGAEYVVTPCHNCHSGIEDILKEFNVHMHVIFFSELLVDHCMEIPEHLKAKD